MVLYEFEWDPAKARRNSSKHAVSFEDAAGVFRDRQALTAFDEAHSKDEERWYTIGAVGSGLLVVHHTYQSLGRDRALIRIFSARKAGKDERAEYRRKR